ncbi:MAG: FAD-dependent oxidoreductase [Candidatus Binatia bacterium]
MSNYDFDLIVIGAGSGGLATSKRAASYGARVAIIENDRVGGTCVIRGCVPKKLMVYAAEFAHAFEDAAGYGWQVEPPSLDWPALVAARDRNVASLEATHERLLREAGVELIHGRARVVTPHEVEIFDPAGGGADGTSEPSASRSEPSKPRSEPSSEPTGEPSSEPTGEPKRISAAHILIATGSRPNLPDIEGIGHVITSDGFFELTERPREVALIGGGYIGCELAGVLQSLGSQVHLIYRGELPLRGFDGDLRRELDAGMRAAKIQVHSGTVVSRIAKSDSAFALELVGPDGACTLTVDCCMLYATGRIANTGGLGLEAVGVSLDEVGNVVCAEDASTSVPSIVAIGDVTGRSPLTPVAIHAGRLWADRVYGGRDVPMSYENIPSAVFTDPPIGTVGMSEEEARVRYGDAAVRIYRARFRPMLHSLTGRSAFTMVKLVVRIEDDRVLGCHVIGKDAPEIIQGFAVAVKMGATKRDFDATVGIHPSTAEELVTLR